MACGLSVSHVVIAAPSVFDRQCHGVDVDDTVATGTGGNSDRFAHVANCCDGPFEHTALLIVVEVLEPVGVTDEFGNETVGQGHGMRLPGRLKGVNGRPSRWGSSPEVDAQAVTPMHHGAWTQRRAVVQNSI